MNSGAGRRGAVCLKQPRTVEQVEGWGCPLKALNRKLGVCLYQKALVVRLESYGCKYRHFLNFLYVVSAAANRANRRSLGSGSLGEVTL